MPFRLILASSMAKVMWSWCSIPLATLLNATYIPEKNTFYCYTPNTKVPCCYQVYRSDLEEVLGDESESLRMVADVL